MNPPLSTHSNRIAVAGFRARFRLAACSQVFLGLFISFGVNAAPLDTWVQRSPIPTGKDIIGVAYVNGQFLATADVILSSLDGGNWTNRSVVSNPAVFYQLTSIAYGVGQYVAVGYYGQVLTSTNAVDWIPQWSGVTLPLASVAYGAGRFVAVGGGGPERAILDSEDGVHWTVRRLSNEGGLNQVVFGLGRFYSVGDSGAILSSANGADWQQVSVPSLVNWTGIAASGKGRLVAVGTGGGFLTSTDGRLWTTNGPALQSRFPSVAAGDEHFVIVDGDRTWVSTNGVDWVAQRAPGLYAAGALTYGAGAFVAVGSRGFVATSTNGVKWAVHSSGGPDVLFYQVTAGGGAILARGDASTPVLLKSANGANWTDTAIAPLGFAPFGMAFAGGQFIVFCQDNRNPESIFVLTSTDASRWTINGVPQSAGAYRIIYGNGQYIGAGAGTLSSSSDGQHWTVQQHVGLNSLSGIAYGNGRYVAVGDEENLFVSTSGTDWAPRPTGTNWFTDVAFGNGQFVAIGSGYELWANGRAKTSAGEILTSSDGETWTLRETPFGPAAGIDLNSIAYGGGWFVIVGGGGVILTSADGIHWTAPNSPTKAQLASVAYADGPFVAVGQLGTTLVSGNVLTATLGGPRISPNGFGFVATGQPGQAYRVVTSTDLTETNWTEIGNLTNQNGQVLFLDPDAGQSSRRFYRLINPQTARAN